MSRIDDAESFIRQSAERVSAYLATLFADDTRPHPLFAAMNYSLLGGGKRLRPVLCMAAAQTFGVALESTLPAAAALELVHCYSLIHDDLPAMDNDDLRRGRPTNHKVFGEATALLAGDALLTYAFELLAGSDEIPAERRLAMIHTLARAAGPYGMIGGQQADLLAEGREGSLTELEFIHVHKTAKLLQAAVVIGGLFAELSMQQQQALAEYGLKLGLAFQIIDDWLDVAGSPEQTGKATGSDERLQKLTYPRLVGLEQTRALADRALDEALAALASASIDAPLLRGIGEYVVHRDH